MTAFEWHKNERIAVETEVNDAIVDATGRLGHGFPLDPTLRQKLHNAVDAAHRRTRQWGGMYRREVATAQLDTWYGQLEGLRAQAGQYAAELIEWEERNNDDPATAGPKPSHPGSIVFYQRTQGFLDNIIRNELYPALSRRGIHHRINRDDIPRKNIELAAMLDHLRRLGRPPWNAEENIEALVLAMVKNSKTPPIPLSDIELTLIEAADRDEGASPLSPPSHPTPPPHPSPPPTPLPVPPAPPHPPSPAPTPGPAPTPSAPPSYNRPGKMNAQEMRAHLKTVSAMNFDDLGATQTSNMIASLTEDLPHAKGEEARLMKAMITVYDGFLKERIERARDQGVGGRFNMYTDWEGIKSFLIPGALATFAISSGIAPALAISAIVATRIGADELLKLRDRKGKGGFTTGILSLIASGFLKWKKS